MQPFERKVSSRNKLTLHTDRTDRLRSLLRCRALGNKVTPVSAAISSGEEAHCMKAADTDTALAALVDDDPVAFMQAMKPDLSGRLAQPLVDVTEGNEMCCRLPRSRRKWGFVSLQFGYAIHLAILLQSVRVLEALLEDSAEHLAQLEADGSTVVHTLARCQMYAPRFKRAKRLETALLSTLSREPRLLDRLVTQEDSSGLRPLEACVKFAAFRLARKMMHLPNYLLKSETRSGGWAVRLYDLTDYDLRHGGRCGLSPLHLLTYVASSQVDSLKKSKLMEDPLTRQWLKLTISQTRLITLLRLLILSFPTVVFLVTVVAEPAMVLVSCFGMLIHCNRATYAAVYRAGYNFSAVYNETFFYEIFFRQKAKNQQCQDTVESLLSSYMMISVLAGFHLLILLIKSVLHICERAQTQRIVAPTESFEARFIRRSIFVTHQSIAAVSGILFFMFASLLQNSQFYLYLQPGSLTEQIFIGSNTLFIAFTLLHFAQYLEIVSKSVGKLFFTFHCMLSSFLAALPLLFYWIILFSLDFYILVNSADFETGLLSLYSSVKIILNMITFDLDSAMVLIIHVLFFVFVALNLLNFLIAFVTETFQRCNSDFDVAFDLLRLLAALKTFRYFRPLFRLTHWLAERSHGSCRRRVVVEVIQPVFKKL